jgi:hypothetical protein
MKPFSFALRHTIAGIAAALSLAAAPVHAQVKFEARYTISVARIPIGESNWTLDFGADQYDASASANAKGVLRVLASGKGTFAARGIVKHGVPAATHFTAKTDSDNDKVDIKMTLDGGTVTELDASQPPPSPDRVPLTDEHRAGILDPLSAMLIAAAGSDGALAPQACRRTLPLFDGRRRFDLALSFKRMGKVAAENGYRGPALVCAVTLEPLAGYRPSSPVVKYLTDGREIELWLAPIAGTHLLAPFRLSIASMLGNLVVEAYRFEAATPARAAVGGATAN